MLQIQKCTKKIRSSLEFKWSAIPGSCQSCDLWNNITTVLPWVWILFMNMNMNTTSVTYFEYEYDCFQLFKIRTRLFYIIHIHEWYSYLGGRGAPEWALANEHRVGRGAQPPEKIVGSHRKVHTLQGNNLQLLRFRLWRPTWRPRVHAHTPRVTMNFWYHLISCSWCQLGRRCTCHTKSWN